jgi:hypothetical protein
VKGATGATGASGAEGKEGPKGATGATGPEGKHFEVGKWEAGKTATSGTEIENTTGSSVMIVLTVTGKKEAEASATVSVEGVTIAETKGGNGGITSGDTSKITVTFVVGPAKSWKVTSANAEKLTYAQTTV